MLIKKDDASSFKIYEFPDDDVNNMLKHSFNHKLEQVKTSIDDRFDDITETSKMIFEKGYKDGKDLGFEQGVHDGTIKGIEQGRQQAVQSIMPLKNTLELASDDFNKLQEQYKSLLRESTLQLVSIVAKQVTETEIKMDTRIIKHWIEKTIEDLPDKPSEIVIYLSQKDLVLLEQNFQLDLKNCSIKEASLLDSGQVDIRTDVVDIFIDAKRKIDDLVDEYRAT